jgi:hypothetical protein
MASSGGDAAWVFPWFIPCFGASTAEVFNYFWWQPAPDSEKLLQQFAQRIAGRQAGPHLRNAWKYASQAIDHSPELNAAYFTGVYYIGPAHPMCADPNAIIPDEFKTAGITSFVLAPTGNVPVFAKFYRKMADSLELAAKEIDLADKVAPKANRLSYDAEVSNIRWFYHTFRSTANYYESCIIRDKLLALAKKQDRSPQEITEAKTLYAQWRKILLDEKENSIKAIPVVTADMRLDPYYGYDGGITPGKFHSKDMIAKKLEILETEINDFLPSVAKRCGIEPK